MVDQVVIETTRQDVIIELTSAPLVIEETLNEVVVEMTTTIVEITSPGPQGPPGPAGGGGGTRFEQAFTNATVVVVNHMLGYEPHVTVEVNGEAVDADIVYGSLNQVTVTFAAPHSGKVICS